MVRGGPDAGCFESSPPVDYFLDPYQTHMLHYGGLRHLHKEIQAERNQTKCLNTGNHILVHLILNGDKPQVFTGCPNFTRLHIFLLTSVCSMVLTLHVSCWLSPSLVRMYTGSQFSLTKLVTTSLKKWKTLGAGQEEPIRYEGVIERERDREIKQG